MRVSAPTGRSKLSRWIPVTRAAVRREIEADPGLGDLLDVLAGVQQSPPRLDEAARIAGRSRATLARRFRDLFGRTYGDVARRIRLEQARRLLLAKREWTVDQIASEVGYATGYSLTRAFAARFEMTPGAYRQARSAR